MATEWSLIPWPETVVARNLTGTPCDALIGPCVCGATHTAQDAAIALLERDESNVRTVNLAAPDFDLLAKMASGEGGTRTGVLKRCGYLEWTVTDAGRQALAVHRGVESARTEPLEDLGSFSKHADDKAT